MSDSSKKDEITQPTSHGFVNKNDYISDKSLIIANYVGGHRGNITIQYEQKDILIGIDAAISELSSGRQF